MKVTKTELKRIIKEELEQVIEEGTLSDMDDDFRERLSGWADAAKDLGVSVQDLLGSMKHLPGAAGEAAMRALEELGRIVKDTTSIGTPWE
jgi:uncharacterized protein YoxC